MNVNGIGATGYPAAGYETRRTGRNVAGGNFAEQAAEAAQEQPPCMVLMKVQEILQSAHGRML